MPNKHIAQQYITGKRNVSTEDLRRMKIPLKDISKKDKDSMEADSRQILKDFE